MPLALGWDKKLAQLNSGEGGPSWWCTGLSKGTEAENVEQRRSMCSLRGSRRLAAREVRLHPEVLCGLPGLLPLELEAGLAMEFS